MDILERTRERQAWYTCRGRGDPNKSTRLGVFVDERDPDTAISHRARDFTVLRIHREEDAEVLMWSNHTKLAILDTALIDQQLTVRLQERSSTDELQKLTL